MIDIKGYEGFYQLCPVNGYVKNVVTGRILKFGFTGGGKTVEKRYKSVVLCKGKDHKRFLIHRLIAMHFIPNPNNKEQVNHINANKHDNRIENLEWATAQENIIHSHKMGLCKYNLKLQNKPCVINGVKYNSVNDAAAYYNTDASYLSKIIRGISPSKKYKVG